MKDKELCFLSFFILSLFSIMFMNIKVLYLQIRIKFLLFERQDDLHGKNKLCTFYL